MKLYSKDKHELYKSLATKNNFVVNVPVGAFFGDLNKSLPPNGSYEVVRTVSCQDPSRNRTSRPMAGYASTQQRDRQREQLIQKGLDFQECVDYGWLNDDHIHSTAHVLGFPTEVELHRSEKEGLRWFLKGFLLDENSFPKGRENVGSLDHVNRVWATALALQGTNRRLGLSVEGQITDRRGHIVLKALIRNVAITAYPVNTGCTWDVFLDTMEGTESYLQALTGGSVHKSDNGISIVGDNTNSSNPSTVYQCPKCNHISKSHQSATVHENSCGHVQERVAASTMSVDQAILYVMKKNPQYTYALAKSIVDMFVLEV